MSRWTVSGIVLATKEEGESDLAVNLFTLENGRLRVTVKSALRSRVRFPGVFDLGHLVSAGIMSSRRSGRLLVEHAVAVEQFPRFRESAARLARAAFLLELVNTAAAEHEPAAPVFRELKEALYRLHREPDSDRWAVAYGFRLLALLGYRPGMETCLRCGKTAGAGTAAFSIPAGGLLCKKCEQKETRPSELKPGSPYRIELSLDTVRTLSEIMKARPEMLPRIQFTANALIQSRKLLGPFIAYHLSRPSRALEFLSRLEPGG